MASNYGPRFIISAMAWRQVTAQLPQQNLALGRFGSTIPDGLEAIAGTLIYLIPRLDSVPNTTSVRTE
jgi:hypothetical protein